MTQDENENANTGKAIAGTPANGLPIKGAFNRYDSPFMQLVAPLIATRYLWLAIKEINPRNFLGNEPQSASLLPYAEKPGFTRYLRNNFLALGIGATFLGIMGLYSRNTLHDIQSLYSEAVGYELGKKKEDVTLGDLFFKSENAALKVTRGAYVRRTLARLATAATFFVPWQKFRDFKQDAPKYDANANAGIGAVGLYLMGEGFLREPSFFDAEQNMAQTAIHHADTMTHQIVRPEHIQALLTLQRRHLDKHYRRPDASSREGQEERALATRIANLLNQTYRNAPQTENAHFTLGKFNFLVGFALLDSFPSGLAFVELANRSADMQEVKQAAAAMKNGADAREVFGRYGIDISALHAPAAGAAPLPAQTEARFALRVGEPGRRTPKGPQTEARFALRVGEPGRRTPKGPQTHFDFAEKTSDPQLNL